MAYTDTKDFRRRDEQTGQWIYSCPEGCLKEGTDEALEFDSLYRWKRHMQEEHGGVPVSDDDEQAVAPSTAPSGTRPNGPGQAVEGQPAPKPKRMSQKNRELNDKLNRCVNLCIKHFIQGLNDLEREELIQLRGEVSMAFVGVEFDFDEKLVSISGKWAALIVIAALYVIPQLPTLKEIISQAKAKAAEKKP